MALQDRRRLLSTCTLCLLVYWLSKPDSSHHDNRHGIISRSSHGGLGFYLKSGLPAEFSPSLIWLMSWPLSGEEYIMTNVEHVSNLSPASNYANSTTPKDQANSISIYPRHPEGPFWEGLGVEKRRPLPEKLVMTETHCAGTCIDCPPEKYLVNQLEDFMLSCRTTNAKVDKTTYVSAKYPRNRVKKAVHVIRNPFINIIARFYRERSNRKKDKDFQKEYPDLPIKGFQKWCRMLDSKYEKEDESAFKKVDPSMVKDMRSSLCHAEIYKYIQWHNMAFKTTETMKLPVHYVYYEDFQKDFKGTHHKLLDFLELKAVYTPYDFPVPHNYTRYFTPAHRAQIYSYAKKLASETTWEYIHHYFFKNATLD